MNFVRNNPLRIFLIAVAVLAVGVLWWRISGPGAPVEEDVTRVPVVNLLSASEYGGGRATISTVGEVESLEQVELRSQISERVSRINVDIGDKVVAGQALVEFENTQLLAQLRQTEAALEAERAGLSQAEQGLINSYANVPNTLSDAFSKVDDAVHVKTGQLFHGSEIVGYFPAFSTCGGILNPEVSDLREEVENSLNSWKRELNSLPSDASQAELDTALANGQSNVVLARDFIEGLSEMLSETCTINESSLDGARVNTSLARTNILLAVDSVNRLAQAIATQKIAAVSGEETSLQGARVKAAESTYQGALAQFEKTIIRSPISGTVAGVPVRLGDLVSPGMLVASVVNTEGLQIQAFMNSRDVVLINERAQVLIEGRTEGIVTRIAPSIDPTTNKVELVIAVSDDSPDLIVGQFVNVDIKVSSELAGGNIFLLPLAAVKTTSDASYVYTVDADGKVEQQSVELGRVVGEQIEVVGGLESTASIIESIRGLTPGDKVAVQ